MIIRQPDLQPDAGPTRRCPNDQTCGLQLLRPCAKLRFCMRRKEEGQKLLYGCRPWLRDSHDLYSHTPTDTSERRLADLGLRSQKERFVGKYKGIAGLG
jgi:hypothetical protein